MRSNAQRVRELPSDLGLKDFGKDLSPSHISEDPPESSANSSEAEPLCNPTAGDILFGTSLNSLQKGAFPQLRYSSLLSK